MKIGVITTPNTKGQIVIPKRYRDALAIDQNVPLNIVLQDDGLWVHPVVSVETRRSKEHLLEVLKRTQGAWAGDKDWDKKEKKQRKLELSASKKAREEW